LNKFKNLKIKDESYILHESYRIGWGEIAPCKGKKKKKKNALSVNITNMQIYMSKLEYFERILLQNKFIFTPKKKKKFLFFPDKQLFYSDK